MENVLSLTHKLTATHIVSHKFYDFVTDLLRDLQGVGVKSVIKVVTSILCVVRVSEHSNFL